MERLKWAVRKGERGLTLVEALAAVVMLTFGLLVLLDVLPRGLRLGQLGNDQGRATALAQQKVEYYKSLAATFTGGNYGTLASMPECFDENGNSLSSGSACSTAFSNQQAYYARDVQIQYWIWNGSQFVVQTIPSAYTPPTSGAYLYRVSVATYWFERSTGTPPPGMTCTANQAYCTAFQAPSTGPSGCVVNNASVPNGFGCIQVSTVISP